MKLLKSSGLLDHAELYAHLLYNESSYDWLKEEYKDYKNIKWIFNPRALPDEKETPTAILMKEVADSATEEFYALYLHQKCVTHSGKPTYNNCVEWRHMMQYWNIERWRDCVSKLDEGYDSVGCCLVDNDWLGPHYSGNIWWSRSSYLQKCRKYQPPAEVGFDGQGKQQGHNRCHYDVESWLGTANGKMATLYNSGVNHYHVSWPKERYR
jgi:hypothetical protein